MRSSRFGGITAATLAVLAAGAGLFQPTGSGRTVPGFMASGLESHPTPKDVKANASPAESKAARLMHRAATSGTKHSYPNGPGWTVAQVQRMARKKRNVARNRRAHRG